MVKQYTMHIILPLYDENSRQKLIQSNDVFETEEESSLSRKKKKNASKNYWKTIIDKVDFVCNKTSVILDRLSLLIRTIKIQDNQLLSLIDISFTILSINCPQTM